MNNNEVKELEKTKNCEFRFFSGDCKYRCNAGTEYLECIDYDNKDCIYRQLLQLKAENEKLNYIIDKQDRQLTQEFENFNKLKEKLGSQEKTFTVEEIREILFSFGNDDCINSENPNICKLGGFDCRKCIMKKFEKEVE